VQLVYLSPEAIQMYHQMLHSDIKKKLVTMHS